MQTSPFVRVSVLFCLATAPLSCASGPSAGYAQRSASARQATAPLERAEHWMSAADAAKSEKYRAEALYRAAHAWVESGNSSQGLKILAQLSEGTSTRAERATFDHAELTLKLGPESEGWRELEAATLRYPTSGLAPKAALRLSQRYVQTDGADAAIVWIDSVSVALGRSKAAQRLLLERARLLEETTSFAAAEQQYTELARRFPYPSGAYWDEATLRAAELRFRLGRYPAADQLLAAMISQRETAAITGSYERRYSQAQWLRAQFAESAGRLELALEHYQALAKDYPSSRLVDDARFAVARLLLRLGDSIAACAAASDLGARHPSSKFARCAYLLCPRLPRLKRSCPEEAAKEIAAPAR